MQSKPLSTYLVTGGAGFIGSHLVDSLLADSNTLEVRILDNFSSGRAEHIAQHEGNPRLKVIKADLLSLDSILEHFQGVDFVYHLAANPDARWGIDNTRLDLEQETIATYHVLEAMRKAGTSRILLSSSGTVYGDVGITAVTETHGPCLPISLYGAGKVASEALITAFCGSFGISGIILRFGNIVGERTTHGIIYDFIRKLALDSTKLEVLGNGQQSKPYVHVGDLVLALRHLEKIGSKLKKGQFDVFNVAPRGGTTVRFITETLLKKLNLEKRTQVNYGDTDQGWSGDVPRSRMDSSKLESTGFHLPRTSDQALELAIERILEWVGSRPEAEALKDGLRLPRG